ncbi:uncharacterized protein LOC106403610 [Brassica napus]|uniref:uncharacterized protein LOC106403610 n=1 Tax=Brassica napus TaxID=3708 RepID=UPI0006AAB65C|nr:uncharacterized protein LOC106403610 [Brassica napus]
MKIEDDTTLDEEHTVEHVNAIGLRFAEQPLSITSECSRVLEQPVAAIQKQYSHLPWFAEIANFLAAEKEPLKFTGNEKRKFLREARQYVWDEPYLYKHCKDGIFRRCVPEADIPGILHHCHVSSYQGTSPHSKWFPKSSKQNYILEVEVFDCWGVDFMGPFPPFFKNEYILVAVDYVSNWVEAVASPTNDAKVVTKMFSSIIFPRFGVPRVVISNGGTHFINKPLKLDDALWTYRTAYKTPLRTTPYHLVYGKACHLPVEYKAAWAKLLNFDIKPATERRIIQIHELEKIRHHAYESSKIYKEKIKAYHDKRIIARRFEPNDKVLLFNSRLWLFPGKLKSRWSGPFTIKEVRPYGAVELLDRKGDEFVVNGQRIKHYLADSTIAEGEEIPLSDPPSA